MFLGISVTDAGSNGRLELRVESIAVRGSESQIVKIAMCCFIPFTSAISYHELTMADDIDEQVTTHSREILPLVRDVKDRTLRELTSL
jgi:hypothetical protein